MAVWKCRLGFHCIITFIALVMYTWREEILISKLTWAMGNGGSLRECTGNLDVQLPSPSMLSGHHLHRRCTFATGIPAVPGGSSIYSSRTGTWHSARNQGRYRWSWVDWYDVLNSSMVGDLQDKIHKRRFPILRPFLREQYPWTEDAALSPNDSVYVWIVIRSKKLGAPNLQQ